jgi:hypothetical protein
MKSNQRITATRLKPIRINKAEFDKFRDLQNPKKMRNDCHAAFSTNPSEDTWRFETFGLTREQLRVEVRNQSPKLDQVFGLFIEERPTGGRFLIDDLGVYWKDSEKNEHRFVEWKPEEPLRPPPRNQTIAERRKERESCITTDH